MAAEIRSSDGRTQARKIPSCLFSGRELPGRTTLDEYEHPLTSPKRRFLQVLTTGFRSEQSPSWCPSLRRPQLANGWHSWMACWLGSRLRSDVPHLWFVARKGALNSLRRDAQWD